MMRGISFERPETANCREGTTKVRYCIWIVAKGEIKQNGGETTTFENKSD